MQALTRAQALGLDRLDAQLLLLHALGRGESERAWLVAHDTDTLPDEQVSVFAALCQCRLAGEPVAYLLGHKEFWGLLLRVDARVLVPRPDTETLVEWALEILDTMRVPAATDADRAADRGPQVLDLGTGSGAIALALAHARPALRVAAVDRSADALAVARDNATRLGLAIDFRLADWLDGAPTGLELIVSNPPYIADHDPHLAALAHEPRAALAAGPDGLADLRAITAASPHHLATGGWLMLEHGWDQAEAVRGLLAQAGFEQVQSRADLAGHLRCSGGRWQPQSPPEQG
jgi:release factor glutamine methyltransferase